MKPLNDYSFIRGFCYPGGWLQDKQTVEKELGYARRLQLNSARIWLMKRFYDEDPEGFVAKLKDFIRTAYSFGITTMPILWNGNMLDESILEEANWPKDEKYVKHIVEELKDEEGMIMWDIMNEPSCNDYLRKAPEDVRPARLAKMWKFVRHYCEYVRSLDPVNAITVGHTFVEDVEPTADCVDVLSFHDYLETRKRVENTYIEAEKLAEKFGKPLINSELACLGRSNPYEMSLEICDKHHVGWYLFELMIHGYWADVHGIVYPDGTVRDPSIVSAIFGFYRNRDKAVDIKPNPNKEGHVYLCIKEMEAALKQDMTLFLNKKPSTDGILEAAEYCANMLECSEMVPMYEPPTMKIMEWRKLPEEQRDAEAIRAFAYDLMQTLKKYSQIF